MFNAYRVSKSQPTYGEVRINVPLTNIAVAFLQNPANFVAAAMFPEVPVNGKSGSYQTWPKAAFRRSDAKKRAIGAAAVRSGWNGTPATYEVERDALGTAIPDGVRDNWNVAGDPDMMATEYLAGQMLLAQEVDFASKYFVSSVWDNNGAQGAGAWELAASTPIEDMRTAQRTLLSTTGFEGNTLLLGYKCFHNLIDHPDIIDRIKGGAGPGNPALFNEVGLAQVLGVSRVVVAKASYQTEGEGQTAANTMVLGTRKALLVYAAPAPAINAPSAGYTLTWGGSGNGAGVQVTRYRDDQMESDVIEMGKWYQHKVAAASLGVYWDTAVAA